MARTLALTLAIGALSMALSPISDVVEVLSEPPQYMQMQTSDFRLTYNTENRLYRISCVGISNERHRFELSEKELKEYADPLLPYLESDRKPVNTWPEVEDALKEGNDVYLADHTAHSGVTVIITGYDLPASLYALEVKSQLE